MSPVKKQKPAKAKKKISRTYKDAGVDIQAGSDFVNQISPMVRSTFNSRVITDIGGFSGLYHFEQENYDSPVLVSSTDGVGTKLKVAFLSNKHDTVGIDLVAMSVNDILAQGAKPLFFLDYLAVSKLDIDLGREIIKGIVEGCKQANCVLLGGETAELPDFYSPGEYDLAGFVVGVVDREKIIDGSEIRVGDCLIGLESTGLHSNGYSLARQIILESEGLKPDDKFLGSTVAEELLKPTKIYVNVIHVLARDFKVKGIANITGGGIIDNLPRILPKSCQAMIDKSTWPRLPIFDYLKEKGDVAEKEMYRTFNMGLGMILVVPEAEVEEIMERLAGMDEKAYLIGNIKKRPANRPRIVLNQGKRRDDLG